MEINYDQFADIYDIDMGSNMGDVDIDFYLGGGEGRSPVLELGCGTGRILQPFASRGVEIVGVDISKDMIQRAKERLGSLAPERCTIVYGDMSNFKLPQKFDYAICAFSTYSKLLEVSQQRSFFRCVYDHLKPSGLFALDMFVQTPDFVRILDGTPIPDYTNRWHEREQCWVSRSKKVWKEVEPSINRIELTYTFTSALNGRRSWTRVLNDYTRYSAKEELEQLFKESGFTVANVYSGYDRRRYEAGSEKMIFEARKGL